MLNSYQPFKLSIGSNEESISKIRTISEQIRTQSHILEKILYSYEILKEMWSNQFNLNLVIYSIHLHGMRERDIFLDTLCADAWNHYRIAYQRVSRTVRGPSMSNNLGENQLLDL